MATVLQEHLAHAPGMNTAAAHLAANLREATVEVRTQGHGNGSGIIWRADGLIITNDHVVHGEHVEVVLADGTVFPAQVVDRDPDNDLAALHVDAKGLPAAPIGDSSNLRVGELVLAMGNPLGMKSALTVGIVHMVATTRNAQSEHRWIRADLSLLPGNSGGPMVNAQGAVIGVNSMVVGGLALAVPSNTVERFLAGKTRPAFLGVETQVVSFPKNFATQANISQETGLMVLGVVEGGPAARNGLLPGDILVKAGNTAVTDHQSLIAVLRDSTTGTPLPLTIIRGGATLEVTAILGERDTEAR
jgi:serine protease Do